MEDDKRKQQLSHLAQVKREKYNTDDDYKKRKQLIALAWYHRKKQENPEFHSGKRGRPVGSKNKKLDNAAQVPGAGHPE